MRACLPPQRVTSGTYVGVRSVIPARAWVEMLQEDKERRKAEATVSDIDKDPAHEPGRGKSI